MVLDAEDDRADDDGGQRGPGNESAVGHQENQRQQDDTASDSTSLLGSRFILEVFFLRLKNPKLAPDKVLFKGGSTAVGFTLRNQAGPGLILIVPKFFTLM